MYWNVFTSRKFTQQACCSEIKWKELAQQELCVTRRVKLELSCHLSHCWCWPWSITSPFHLHSLAWLLGHQCKQPHSDAGMGPHVRDKTWDCGRCDYIFISHVTDVIKLCSHKCQCVRQHTHTLFYLYCPLRMIRACVGDGFMLGKSSQNELFNFSVLTWHFCRFCRFCSTEYTSRLKQIMLMPVRFTS